MLRRLWLGLKRDSLINVRSHFLTVTLAVAVIYLVLVAFLIPTELTVSHTTYLVDQTTEQRVAALLQKAGVEGLQLLTSPDELRRAMAENAGSAGILLAEGQPLPATTLFFQGHESDRFRNLVDAKVESLVRAAYGQAPAGTGQVRVEVDTLHAAAPAAIPLNHHVLPLFLFSDPGLVGMMFIAALIFLEKSEGTILAYRVSPGRLWEYLLTKAASLALLAVIFALIMTMPILGAGPNYLHLLALMIMSAMATSLVGAWMAVHFDNLSQAVLPLVAVVTMLTAPMASYFNPGFAPLWLRLLPTYPTMYGIREALFPSGHPSLVYNALLSLLAWSAIGLFLAVPAFRRQLARS